MKRSTWTGDTVVYRYGCPWWADLDADGLRQLELAAEWRNELVRVERRYEAMSHALWQSIPTVAVAQQSVDEATASIEAVVDEMKQHRIRSQSTVPHPQLKARLVAARASRKAAKQVLKAAKVEAKPVHQQLRAELDTAKRCAAGGCTRATCQFPDVPHPYRRYVQQAGLGHGTYNDVIDKHRVSVARVIALRKAGLPARHRYSGSPHEGTLTVQIKYGDRVNRDHWAFLSVSADNACARASILRPVWRPVGHGRALPVILQCQRKGFKLATCATATGSRSPTARNACAWASILRARSPASTQRRAPAAKYRHSTARATTKGR